MRTYSSLGIEKTISLGFLSIILAGTLLIYLVNHLMGGPLPFLDVLFTVTSATCVTGLAVFDIGTMLTFPSQLLLLLCIQIGGLGLMTVSTALPLLLRQRIGLRARLFLAGGLGINTPQGAILLLKRILYYTFFIEGIGAAILFTGFLIYGESPLRAVYQAIFHSISAFCNAGFSLYSTGLIPFEHSLIVPAAIMILIVTGGIGFPVMSELRDFFSGRLHHLSGACKTVLTTTAVLIVSATAIFCLIEWNVAFAHLPVWAKIWNALFASITPRTAGFETVSFQSFSGMGAAFTILLMIIGASPASTGGGIKTTTLTVLLWTVWAELKNEDEVILWKRHIESRTIRKALSLVVMYLGTLFIGTALLSITENSSISTLFFEAASALGTVGLTRGATSDLTNPGKIVIICLMYWGRVGLMTFFYSLIKHEKRTEIHYPREDTPIG